jgi:hypothetical protein
MPTSDKKSDELLRDLRELANYLHERGEKTRILSSQFAQHAQENSSDREFDLNQSRMLDYQHNLWHEIGNMVDKLIKKYDQK